VNSTDLDVVLVSNGLELILLLAKIWESDVDRSTESSSKISRARGNVTKMLIMSEFGNLFDLSGSLGESSEDCTDVSTLLH